MRRISGNVPIFALALGVSLTQCACAEITWNVAFEDPDGAYADYYSDIAAHTIAAGDEWTQYMDPSLHASLEVTVAFDPDISTANAASVVSSMLENRGDFIVWEFGAAAEIKSGIDPNGAVPDILITLGTDFLTDTLWFYDDPVSRQETVPGDKKEAYFYFLHELGHALAYNGWSDPTDGSLAPEFASPFDLLLRFDGENFFFTGPTAVEVYGGDVPLTYGNHFHLGNESPRPGDDLLHDVMNGVVAYTGTQYSLSTLDLAIAFDLGLPVVSIPFLMDGDFDGDGVVSGSDFLHWQLGESPDPVSPNDLTDWVATYGEAGFLSTASTGTSGVPEPGTCALLVTGLAAMALRRVRKKRRPSAPC